MQAKRLPDVLSLVIGNVQSSKIDSKLDQELKGILRELEMMALNKSLPAKPVKSAGGAQPQVHFSRSGNRDRGR